MNTKRQDARYKMQDAKKIGIGLLAIALLALGKIGKLEAASTDSIQLIVQPAVNYSVQITSADANVAYDFGTVDLDLTTRSERPAVVLNNGNIVSEWQISADKDGTTWTLGNSTGTQDVAVLKALFNSLGGPVPTDADYNTVDGSTITVSTRHSDTLNTALSTTVGNLNNLAINAQRDLFFMLHTPNTSSVGTQQDFRVYITAVAPQ